MANEGTNEMKWNLFERMRERRESARLDNDRLLTIAKQEDREDYFGEIRDQLAVNIFIELMDHCDEVLDDGDYRGKAVSAVTAANALVAELEQVSK